MQTEERLDYLEGGALQKGPNDLKAVSDTLKIALWNHVKNTKDKDKFEQVEKAFKPTTGNNDRPSDSKK